MVDPTRELERPAPPAGSVQRWCFDFIQSTDLKHKLCPAPAPNFNALANWERGAPSRRLLAPGRPAEWELVGRSKRTPKLAALVRPEARRRLLHTFIHHELQAAELFAWAILAFPETALEFRQGLLRLCQEELSHLALYRAHLEVLGGELGGHGARDWFWERALCCPHAAAFVAFMGLGLEGANLDHSARFALGFRAAGDLAGAEVLERVGRDEERHVAFAVHWFGVLSGTMDYASWQAALPAPLSPALFRGRPLNRAARMRAGMQAGFLDALEGEPSASTKRQCHD